MPGEAITVASTAYLVVPKDVSCSTAFRAGIGVIVERDTQPVPERTPALSDGGGDPEWENALRPANLLRVGGQMRVRSNSGG